VSGRLPGLSSAGLLVSQVAHLDCAGPGEADALSRPVHMVRPDAMSGINPHRPDRKFLARTAMLITLIGFEGNVLEQEQS
jgi:hypothetical protein